MIPRYVDAVTLVLDEINADVKVAVDKGVDILNDTNAVSIQDRRDVTPISGYEWKTFFGTDGRRGSSRCYPIDETYRQEMLQKYGQDYVAYNSQCEPDFKPFTKASVKISDMNTDRQHNFSAADKKVLNTKWAKEMGFKTPADVKRYRMKNGLTWHETSDGVTMQLVPSEINARFKHSGGVALFKKLDAIKKSDFLTQVRYLPQTTSVRIRQTIVKVTPEESYSAALEEIRTYTPAFINQTGEYVNQYFQSDIHQAGIDAAKSAAVFSGTMAVVRNTYAVIHKEKELDEAVEDTLYTVAASSATAYGMGALQEGIAEAIGVSASAEGMGLLAAGAVQMSKHLIAYASGEINGEQLKESVAETGAYLVAGYIGKTVGGFIGGGIGAVIGSAFPIVGNVVGEKIGAQIGKVVGEMVTTAVCAEVISALKYSKAYEKQSAKIRALCAKAEREIRESQNRLKELIHEKNYELLLACDEGFSLIARALETNDMSLLKGGILRIGSSFGIDESYLSEGEVTLDSLFSDSETMISIY